MRRCSCADAPRSAASRPAPPSESRRSKSCVAGIRAPLRNYPAVLRTRFKRRAFPLAQPPFRRDGRRSGPRGKSVARLAWRGCLAPRRGRPPSRRRRRPRWLPGAEPRLRSPVLGPWRHGRLPLDGVRWLQKPAARAGPVSAHAASDIDRHTSHNDQHGHDDGDDHNYRHADLIDADLGNPLSHRWPFEAIYATPSRGRGRSRQALR
jgi:hypothetical protein